MFHRIIFLLLIVSSLYCNLPLMFSVAGVLKTSRVLNACVIKPLNKKKKHNKFFVMLKCNSINVHSNTPQLATGWPLYS